MRLAHVYVGTFCQLLDKNARLLDHSYMITPQKIRAARALLGLTQARLADAAGLSTTGLNNIETGQSDPKASTLKAIQHALEERGAFFSADGGLYERVNWANGKPADPEIRRRVVEGMNMARSARNQPLLVDEGEDGP
jgi:transcriptional regulator with XRE-family HTH domain